MNRFTCIVTDSYVQSTALWLACRNGFDGLVRAVLKDKRTDPNAAVRILTEKGAS